MDDGHTVVLHSSGRMLYFDGGYLKTLHGLMKIAQILVSLVTFICAILSHGPRRPESVGYWPFRPGHAGWAAFVSFTGLLLTISWLFFHLFHVHDVAPRLPWLMFELVYYVIWCVFFFISGAVLAALANDLPTYPYWGYYYYENIRGAAAAGSFFAFTATILFAVSACFLLRAWRNRPSTNGQTYSERA